MRFECNFGTLAAGKNAAAPAGTRFRIAILGDFSGHALAGQLDTGDALAARKPLKVDVDNLDDLIERMGIKLQLPLGDDGQTAELEIESLDDFHPDQLYDMLEAFEELAALRRRLSNERTFAAAAQEVRGWAEEAEDGKRRRRRRSSRAAVVPVDGKLSDFARLVGQPDDRDAAPLEVDELIKQIVAPYLSASPDPDQEELIAAVDQSLSAMMRSVLHQPEFQALEALWRGIDLLVRRLETGAALQVVLYDISAEELAADLSRSDELEETALYKLLVEQPASDAAAGSLAAIIGNYTFEETPPHAELLGRMAKIAAAANAPFVAAMSNRAVDRKASEPPHPLVEQAWSTLKELPEAKYLALTVPQFLLRLPYGKKSDPVDCFAFEEFTPQSGLAGMLWGNGALLVGLMLGQTFAQQGLKKMQIGSILSFDDMPYHFYTDADGDQIALPCTDRLLSQRMAQVVVDCGYIPVLSLRGQPVVRLGSIQSVAGVELAGVWPPSAEAASLQASDRAAAEQRLAELRSTASQSKSSSDEGFRDDLAWKMKDGTFDDDDDEDEDSDSSDDSSDDLDALLSGGDDDDESSGDDDAEASDSDSTSDDADLDALLASLGGDDDDASASDSAADDDDEGMDPELAALLADL